MNICVRYQRARGALHFTAVAACTLLVSCGGGGGSPAPAIAAASNPVIVSIGASPTALTLGQSTTLAWSSSNATACQASAGWSGTVAISGTQIVTPPAAGTITYTLTCNGVAGSTSVVVTNVAAPVPPPTVSLSFTPASVAAGQTATLNWSTTNATSCIASGAWAGNQATSGSAAVNQSIAGTYTYKLACAGAGGSAIGSVALGVTDLTGNVAPVVIDSGPAGAGGVINVPFVSVTLCAPGTSTCQTIDHVLVDTGSSGLRIIAGALDPSLALPAVAGSGGNPVGECAQFVSGFLWGSVRLADVKIAGETAPSLSVQVAGDTSAAFTRIPSGCGNAGGNMGTVALLGANGILGVGLFNQDCGSACATQANNGMYYACTASGCNGSALVSQVSNPVAAFAVDNNGVALVMPAVANGGATTLTGTLIFGIDTQANNQIGSSATIYAANSSGNFTTSYNGTSGISSFLDSGSNGLFFSDSTIPLCSASSNFNGFYCPTAPLSVSAVNASAVNGASGAVSVTIVNPQTLDLTIRAASIGGSTGRGYRSSYFDWGMPFFFGRTVFVAINGASTGHGVGPYWAY